MTEAAVRATTATTRSIRSTIAMPPRVDHHTGIHPERDPDPPAGESGQGGDVALEPDAAAVRPGPGVVDGEPGVKK